MQKYKRQVNSKESQKRPSTVFLKEASSGFPYYYKLIARYNSVKSTLKAT